MSRTKHKVKTNAPLLHLATPAPTRHLGVADERGRRIAILNDRMRNDPHNIKLGELLLDNRLSARDELFLVEMHDRLANFNEWTPGGDPRGHHDFGCFTIRGVRILFQFQYRDQHDHRLESDDPSNEVITRRILRLEVYE